MASNAEVVRKILGSGATDKSIEAQALLNVISSVDVEEKVELMQIIITEKGAVPKCTYEIKEKGLSDDEWGTLVKGLSQMVDGHLSNAFFKARSPEEFATQLVRLLDFLEGEQEKIVALAKFIDSPYVPFRELPGTSLRLGDGEYEHLLKSNQETVDLIDYVAEIPFEQRTEEVSHVLHVITSVTDHALRCALLAHYMFLKQKSATDALIRRLK